MPAALIVDDDSNFLSGLAEMVGRDCFSTTTARNLKDARSQLAQAVPDVILLDVELPDGNGLDLLKEISGPAPTVVMIRGTRRSARPSKRSDGGRELSTKRDFARVKAHPAASPRRGS
jgi:DNA-binding NtrC family response regulator